MNLGIEHFIGVLIAMFIVICVMLYSFARRQGVEEGFKRGYISALDDIRLGKPAKFKLVKTAEKWVEVEK